MTPLEASALHSGMHGRPLYFRGFTVLRSNAESFFGAAPSRGGCTIAKDAMTQGTIQPSRAGPPGPKGRFLVGNALDFSRGDWFGFFLRCAREHGDVVSFRFLNVPMCLLTHPNDIEDVLVKNAANFVKSRNYHVLKLVLGNGLLTSEGCFCNGSENWPSLRLGMTASRDMRK
jgi:hypothetical protein